MTAYIDRVRLLAGDQPSLQVRPRFRFEPSPPGSEPPWERTPRGAPSPPFDASEETAAHPAAPYGEVPLTTYPPARRPRPATRADLPPPHPERPWDAARPDAPLASSGDNGEVTTRLSARPGEFPLATGPIDRPAPPRGPSDHPDPAGPDPWSGRTGGHGSSGAPPGLEAPAAVSSPPAVHASAARAEAAATQAPPAGPAMPADLSHYDAQRSAPLPNPDQPADPPDRSSGWTGSVFVPAGSGSTASPGDRSGAFPQGLAIRNRPFGANLDLGGRAGPGQPALPVDRVRPIARTDGTQPGEAAGPYPGSFSGPADPAGAADAAAAGRATSPSPGRRGAGREPAGPEEVTVTIGRVEVRVSPPPSAGAAAGSGRTVRARPSQLEDYLRARAAGRIG